MRLSEEVQLQCKIAADSLVNIRRGSDESIDSFLERIASAQQFIVASRRLLSIPGAHLEYCNETYKRTLEEYLDGNE